VNLDPEKLRALLDLLIEKDIAEFEHEDEAARVKIVRGARIAVAPAAMPIPAGAPSKAALEASAPADTVDVTSPFVGTFYRSPSADAPHYAGLAPGGFRTKPARGKAQGNPKGDMECPHSDV